MILKQATAVDVLIGPFVDISDGAAAETGESPSVKLSKNGQALGAKNDATTPVHDADGYYNCELDATDTDTVGTLVLTVAASATALPVRHEFQVVEEDTYEFLYASGSAPDTDIAAILGDTNELQTDDIPGTLATIAAFVDTEVAAILAVANNLPDSGALTSLATAAALATAQTDLDTITGSDGVTLATAQALYAPAKAGDNMGTVSAVTGGVNTAAGTITTLDGLDTAQDSQHATTQGKVDTVDGIADNLVLGIIFGSAATGTLSTTQATSDLTGYADDQLISRIITFTSGACEGESSDITDYANTGGLLTFTALTTAPGNGDTFKIT